MNNSREIVPGQGGKDIPARSVGYVGVVCPVPWPLNYGKIVGRDPSINKRLLLKILENIHYKNRPY